MIELLLISRKDLMVILRELINKKGWSVEVAEKNLKLDK